VKLLEQVLRQERQDGVLRRPDEVVGESSIRVLVRRYVRRNGVVRNDDPVPDALLRLLVVVGRLLAPVPEEELRTVGGGDGRHGSEGVDRLRPRGLPRVAPEGESERVGPGVNPPVTAARRSRLRDSRLGSFGGRIGDPLRPAPVYRPLPFSGIVARRKDEVGLGARPSVASVRFRGHASRNSGSRPDLLRGPDKTGRKKERRLIN